MMIRSTPPSPISVAAARSRGLGAYANAYILRGFAGDSIPAPFGRAIDYGGYRLARWFGLQVTGGSTAVRGTGQYGMCVAGAAAKEMLIAAAAERFGVPPSECQASGSRVIDAASGQSASFGELATAAAALRVPANPVLKDQDTYTIRRTARPRFDVPSKVDGSAIYGIDFAVPGMLYAAIDMAPVFGGTLLSVDGGPAEAMPGVKRVVQLDEAVAVVADSYWHARQALGALNPTFDDAGQGNVSSASIFAAFDEALGSAPDMPDEAANVVTAYYRVPLLAHATMEPMACTVRVDEDSAEVWAGVQDPLNARATAASALDLDAERVQFTNLQLGGGYGRRLPFTLDYVDLGARIAKVMSPTPVKLVWSRENDTQHDYYRPAGMVAIRRRTGHERHAAGCCIVLCRRRYWRGGLHALRDRRHARRCPGRAPPYPAGPVAFGDELPARILQGVVCRRDGPCCGKGPVSLPARPIGRSAALSCRP